jgi:hypothetical protein
MTHTEKLKIARLLKALATQDHPGPLTPEAALNEVREAIADLLPLVRGYDIYAPEYGVEV